MVNKILSTHYKIVSLPEPSAAHVSKAESDTCPVASTSFNVAPEHSFSAQPHFAISANDHIHQTI